MTLIDALQGGANIILAGHPGSGKTVALAWLVSSIIQNNPGLGNLVNYLPLYIHATHLYQFLRHSEDGSVNPSDSNQGNPGDDTEIPNDKSYSSSESLDILIRAISTYVSPLTLTRLPGVVEAALDKQRAILVLDRVDEMPPSQSHMITEYLSSLLQTYPKLRIITALSYDDLAGLPALGFSLLGMSAWTDDDRESFLERWSQHWDKWINPTEKSRAKRIYSYYVKSWLKVNNALLNPLEYMLKVWAAYSGDAIGTDAPSAIEAYIRRMISDSSTTRPGLELFALQLLYEMRIMSSPHDSDQIFKDQENIAQASFANLPEEDRTSSQQSSIVKPAHINALSDLDVLTETGFLVSYTGSNYGFSHPIISGYLAGNALASTGTMDLIQSQPAWNGKTLAMYYFSRVGDVTPYINALIQEDDILHTNHLKISRWLQIAPKNRQWRSTILRTLTTILTKEKETLSLSAKIISAMAFSGDVGVSVYFRQLLKSENPNLMQLAALGCGILAEKKAIDDLNTLVQDQSPTSIRAASLALAAIGDKRSLEILAANLLSGSELSQRYAAEALANNPTEGHPALKEGSSMEDLLVRRSVAFGLIRVNQPWAIKIVENMQLEDSEWVVRNAAVQAFSELQRKITYAPAPTCDPTETQWLIDYAAKVGTTVAPGEPANELVIKALVDGTDDEVLNALEYLRQKCDPETVNYIYRTYSQKTGEIKDTAYYVLWLMMIAGIKLPVSIKYNIE
jgi:HEAT repeat protein